MHFFGLDEKPPLILSSRRWCKKNLALGLDVVKQLQLVQLTDLAVDRDCVFEMPRLTLLAPALLKRLTAHLTDLHQHTHKQIPQLSRLVCLFVCLFGV